MASPDPASPSQPGWPPVWPSAGEYLKGLLTPTLRLGVTGLARSGKTVFITALVRSLVSGGRLPFFGAHAEGRLQNAFLEPQPDDDVPRFDYEAHLACLERNPPEWPESTRRISELRVALNFEPESPIRRALGIGRLNIDIVDYPGEWLVDLGLFNQSYALWASEAISRAYDPARRDIARAWVKFLSQTDPMSAENEQTAITGARIFTEFLAADRVRGGGLVTQGPGRFLMPGDLEGSPLLTFFPLAQSQGAARPRGSLAAMMERRFESYKAHVVRPFFRDHFSRLDRQIVLADVLTALNAGPNAIAELEHALEKVLYAFRPGANSWRNLFMPRRLDRLLFAATKADHLHHTSHDRLEAILQLMTQRAATRALGAGAKVQTLAISALRATREREAKSGKDRLPCIVGVPMPGETIDGKAFDGKREAAVFPGDLPDDPERALSAEPDAARLATTFIRFRPPRLRPASPGGEATPAPHIRLDRVLDFLLGDWLQ